MLIPTLCSNKDELDFDISVYGKIVSQPHRGYAEIKEMLFKEFEIRTPFITLESTRCDLGRLANSSISVDYNSIDLSENESIFEILDTDINEGVFEENTLPLEAQSLFTIENSVTDSKRGSILSSLRLRGISIGDKDLDDLKESYTFVKADFGSDEDDFDFDDMYKDLDSDIDNIEVSDNKELGYNNGEMTDSSADAFSIEEFNDDEDVDDGDLDSYNDDEYVDDGDLDSYNADIPDDEDSDDGDLDSYNDDEDIDDGDLDSYDDEPEEEDYSDDGDLDESIDEDSTTVDSYAYSQQGGIPSDNEDLDEDEYEGSSDDDFEEDDLEESSLDDSDLDDFEDDSDLDDFDLTEEESNDAFEDDSSLDESGLTEEESYDDFEDESDLDEADLDDSDLDDSDLDESDLTEEEPYDDFEDESDLDESDLDESDLDDSDLDESDLDDSDLIEEESYDDFEDESDLDESDLSEEESYDDFEDESDDDFDLTPSNSAGKIVLDDFINNSNSKNYDESSDISLSLDSLISGDFLNSNNTDVINKTAESFQSGLEKELVSSEKPVKAVAKNSFSPDIDNVDIGVDVSLISSQNTVTSKPDIKPVTINESVGERPTDLRKFLRENKGCTMELALKYFSKKEIEDNLKRGRIMKRNGTLRSM